MEMRKCLDDFLLICLFKLFEIKSSIPSIPSNFQIHSAAMGLCLIVLNLLDEMGGISPKDYRITSFAATYNFSIGALFFGEF